MNFFLKSSIKCIKNTELFIKIRRTYLHLNVQLTIERVLEKHVKKQDLPSLREEILDVDSKYITPKNVDYTILSLCNNDNRRNLAVNYVKYLENEGAELNLAAISKLLKIYGSLLQNTILLNKSLDSNDSDQICANIKTNIEEEIVKLYKKLSTKYKVLDTSLTESIIYALSTTYLWKDCIQLLENLQKTTKPTGASYDALCIALFKHGEEETAWKLLQEMVDKEMKPSSTCYKSYILSISKMENYTLFLSKMEILFDFWSTNDILIEEEVANKLKQLFSSKFKKQATLSTINIKADCAKCKLRLPEATLSNEDFTQLKAAFFNKVIIGKDVFRKTTPHELAAFNKLIEENQHYDVIIDGLNVAYSAGVKQPVHITSGHVATVVKHYTRQGKSVLVLGRTHMNKWPHVNEIRQCARLFLTQNLSQDDPYLLYCALNSGKGTIIVSRDMMRGHLYLLNEAHLKQLFKRWLSITQHKLVSVRGDGRIVINAPPSYIQSAQKHENVWHLPVLSEINNNRKSQNGNEKNDPSLWLCIQL